MPKRDANATKISVFRPIRTALLSELKLRELLWRLLAAAAAALTAALSLSNHVFKTVEFRRAGVVTAAQSGPEICSVEGNAG